MTKPLQLNLCVAEVFLLKDPRACFRSHLAEPGQLMSVMVPCLLLPQQVSLVCMLKLLYITLAAHKHNMWTAAVTRILIHLASWQLSGHHLQTGSCAQLLLTACASQIATHHSLPAHKQA